MERNLRAVFVWSALIPLISIGGCECGRRTAAPGVTALGSPSPGVDAAAPPPAPAAAPAPREEVAPAPVADPAAGGQGDAPTSAELGPIDTGPINASSPAPWVARAIRIKGAIYALRNPTKSKLPAGAERPEDPDLEIFQNIFLTKERPAPELGAVTLVSDSSTCVGAVAGRADVYMACNYEMESGEYIKREGLRITGCSELEKAGPYQYLFWAVEGAHPKIGLRAIPEEAVSPGERAALLKTVRAYAAQRSLPEAARSDLAVTAVSRLPSFPTSLVETNGDEYPRLLLVRGDRVVHHFPERFSATKLMVAGGRLFVLAMTELECGNVLVAQGDVLVPFNQDCLYLWCGDGLE